MIRVLHIPGNSLGMHGAIAVIMNYYRQMPKDQIQFDFVTCSPVKEVYDDEIESLGGRIYRLPSRNKHPLKYMNKLRRIIKDNDYKIIHNHQASASMIIEGFVAKLCGLKTIIGHSHCCSCLNKWQHYLFKPIVNYFLDYRFACSAEAGKWIFGNRKDVIIWNNAIDNKQFRFDENSRRVCRANLGIEDRFVIGFVGRLAYQKNPFRLLDIVKKVAEQRKNTLLLVIGNGKYKDQMIDYVKQNNLAENVRFLGERNDVPELMMAFDLFLLPSLFEGLPVVCVEAQATGCNCVVSDKVPTPNIANMVTILSLDCDNAKWAKTILEKQNGCERLARSNAFEISEYNIEKEALKLKNFYLAQVNAL